jgi:exopolyphosphatase / guanosine-5'-triphosphate,3'-diphosphate pyrophosphatase
VPGFKDPRGAEPPERGPASPAGSSPPEPPARSVQPDAGLAHDHPQAAGITPAGPAAQSQASSGPVYAALDLGTNNCRLLVARPSRRGFKVIDAFSRIIRLGEGVTASGQLSDAAMTRTASALQICAAKVARHNVTRARLVATEACRIASNGPAFLKRVKHETGLDIEILSREDEARLAVSGCASLIDADSDLVMVFDIGGGSSELIWLDLGSRQVQRSQINGVPHFSRSGWSLSERVDIQNCIRAWTSLPVGVVTLAERFGSAFVGPVEFEAMVAYVTTLLLPFEAKAQIKPMLATTPVHLLGTSGTVTTIAGVHMALPHYDRNRVDGCWLATTDVRAVTNRLVVSSHEERIAEPCIGRERADLVLAGCAILEAMLRLWPCERLRVADRGLREGILTTLMAEDQEQRRARRW